MPRQLRVPSSPASILRKALAIAADPAAPAGERDSASRRVAEILAKHPSLAAELHRGSEPKPAAPKSQPAPTKQASGKRKANPAPPPDLVAGIKHLRRGLRVIAKGAAYVGKPKVQAGALGLLDLLDEWDRG